MKAYNLIYGKHRIVKDNFQGGFTHANALYVGDNITDRVDSIDFTSSYPAVMLSNLPKPIIGAVPDLYRAKTTLKGMLNSTYGMRKKIPLRCCLNHLLPYQLRPIEKEAQKISNT